MEAKEFSISRLILSAFPHLADTLEMLYKGVAFPSDDNKEYHVFSHEGDELGKLSTAEVNYAIYFAKQHGRPIGKIWHFVSIDDKTFPDIGRYKMAFSLAWEGFHVISPQLLKKAP